MIMEKRFDEGFDNILIYDFDREYQKGRRISAASLVTDGGRETVSLNGTWHFSPDPFGSLVRSRWFDETRENRHGQPIPYDFDFEKWEEIPVPGVWNAQRPEYAMYEGGGIYFRTFSGQEQWSGKQVYLRIGAANYETRVWINGRYLGRHLGGFTPFCLDVTGYVREENRLVASVDNQRKGGQVPSLHYDWFNYGGLFRDVELICVPRLHIKDFWIQLSKTRPGYLEYELTVQEPVCGEPGPDGEDQADMPQPGGEEFRKERDKVRGRICIRELGLEETVICEADVPRGRPESGDRSERGRETVPDAVAAPEMRVYRARGTLAIEEERLRLWSPEDPYVYHVTVRCGEDTVQDQVGFRRIETRGPRIFLNGREIFLKGMCVHEESLSSARCVTREEIRTMLCQVKEMGCNFLRLTHYPHSSWVSRLADAMGVMLLEEIPVYWALEFENPDTYEDASNQLRELIIRDRNRASVILWSVGNENPDTDARYDFMRRLSDLAREMDPTRLITAACLIDVEQSRIRDRLMARLDVVGVNEYYGWYLKDFGTLREILDHYREDKPVIITETGADAAAGYFSDSLELYSEELQAQVYEKQFEILLQYDFIRGITPWILYDYVSMRRRNSWQKGYNIKGIMGADRVYKKKTYDVVKRVYGGGQRP